MALINEIIDYNKPANSKLELVKLNYKVLFNEQEYIIEKSFPGQKWIIKIGKIFDSMLLEILNPIEEETLSLHIFNLEVVDFRFAKLTFLNNKIEIKFNYKLFHTNKQILKEGFIIEKAQGNTFDYGLISGIISKSKKFNLSIAHAVFYCLEKALISLYKEIDMFNPKYSKVN